MADVNSREMAKMNDFLATAAKSGVDKAIALHGEAVNSREAAALRGLSQAELKTLNTINAKITRAVGSRAAADWTCGLLC